MYSVLIVDDEKAIRENLVKAVSFEKYGFKVCGTAINGKDALEKVNQNPPDLILLDVRMPVMNGIRFLEELRKGDHCNIKVIMLSGYSEFEYAKSAMRYGVKAYLTKPVDEEELYGLLKEIHKELENQEQNMTAERTREKMKRLQKMYRGGDGDRSEFQTMFVMHCVMLPSVIEFEEKSLFEALRGCIEGDISGAEEGFFRTRGSIYSYILEEEVLEAYDNNMITFANHLQYLLKKEKLRCSVLFDSAIFQQPESSFRKDYDSHLYHMMTEVFFKEKNIILYEKNFEEEHGKDYSERICGEEQLLENLKKNIWELNWELVENEFEGLIEEIENKHLNVEFLQEINYRIYYMLIDLMASIEGSGEQEAFLRPLEWRENPFFQTFKSWRKIQYQQLKGVYSFIEENRKMSGMGVCAGVIEYIHRHYSEQITIKEVADCFFINSTYLGRTFKKATGKGFKQYVNDLRMEEAKRLLRQTDKLIYEIAGIVGFNESKYFIAKFTEDVGVSPSEYRKIG